LRILSAHKGIPGGYFSFPCRGKYPENISKYAPWQKKKTSLFYETMHMLQYPVKLKKFYHIYKLFSTVSINPALSVRNDGYCSLLRRSQ